LYVGVLFIHTHILCILVSCGMVNADIRTENPEKLTNRSYTLFMYWSIYLRANVSIIKTYSLCDVIWSYMAVFLNPCSVTFLVILELHRNRYYKFLREGSVYHKDISYNQYIETSVRNKCRCYFYCALLTLHVSAPIGDYLQVVCNTRNIRRQLLYTSTDPLSQHVQRQMP
jgi:hypothetical protein